MSIHQFFRILWARRFITLVALLAALIAGLAILKFVPKQYEASSRIMLDIVRPDPVTGEVIQGSFSRAYTNTQIELVRDPRVASRVVEQLGWTGSADLAAQYNASGSDLPFGRWLASIITQRTSARLVDGSTILEISYTSPSPQTASRIANELVDAYEQQIIQFKRQEANSSGSFFEQQTEKLKVELAAAEERKATFEKENGIVLQDDNVDADSAKLAALATASPAPPAMSIPAAPSMPVTSPSQAQLGQIDAAIAVASRSLGPNHPDLIAMRQQRAAVARSAASELSAARAAAAPASTPQNTGPSIGALFDAQRRRVLEQRGKLAEAKQLQGDVNVLRLQLNESATRQAQLDQEASTGDAGITRLSSASSPDAADFPKTVPVLAMAIMLGLGIGFLVSLLTELFNRRVRSVDDLAIEGIPIVGVMDLNDKKPLLPFTPRLTGPN